MIFLVTGGAGFIGAHLARRLLNEGHEVIVFDDKITGNSIQQVLEFEELARVRLVAGDVVDRTHLLNVCRESGAQRIVHLAALLGPDVSLDPARTVRINAESNANVFEVAHQCGVPRVVYASSMMVYGAPHRYPYEVLPNDAPQWPPDLYGACKSLDEALARHYFRVYGLDSVGLRFTIVYGPGRMRGGGLFTAELMTKPALGQPGAVGFGGELVDWLYVDDAARYIVAASLAETEKARAYNTRGDLRLVSDAAAYVKQLLPDAEITLLSGKLAMAQKMDASAIEADLGVRPSWSMEDGIRATINAARKRAGLPLVS